MSVEENKAILRRIYDELWNKGDVTIVPDVISPDYRDTSPNASRNGQQAYADMITSTHRIFPDVHVVIEDMLGEGDQVVARLSMTGTFKGKWREFEPTGNHLQMKQAIFYRFRDGKLVEATNYSDNLAMFRSLGLKPPS